MLLKFDKKCHCNMMRNIIGICLRKTCNIKQYSTQSLIDCIHSSAVQITRKMLGRNNKYQGYHIISDNNKNAREEQQISIPNF